MLIYTYYTNLMSHGKVLYAKYHSFHNDLYNDVLKILIDKLGPIYGIPGCLPYWNCLKLKELKIVWDNLLPVGLYLDLDFKSCQTFSNAKDSHGG